MEKPRYEREIEELLAHMDDFPEASRSTLPRPPATQSRSGRMAGALLRSIDAGKLALVGILLIFVSLIARGSLGSLTQWLVAIGAAMLVGAYILYFTSSRRANSRRSWRGREIDVQREPTVVETWVDQLLARLRRR